MVTNMENIKIRDFKKDKDLDRMMDIWLNSNIDSHDFIDENYWRDNFQYVRDLLPKSDLYIAESEGTILAFMGIIEGYIAGIFVDYNYRKLGIGSSLLDRAKENYDVLSLDVYKKNQNAYNFYINEGFKIIEERFDEENNEIEYKMEYK